MAHLTAFKPTVPHQDNDWALSLMIPMQLTDKLFFLYYYKLN